MRKQQLIFWIALFALPFLVVVLISSLSRRKSLLEQVQLLEREANQILQDNQRLKQLVQGAQSDILKEMEVRKKLNYAKPGEVLVLFVSPSPTPTSPPEVPWWQKIFK